MNLGAAPIKYFRRLIRCPGEKEYFATEPPQQSAHPVEMSKTYFPIAVGEDCRIYGQFRASQFFGSPMWVSDGIFNDFSQSVIKVDFRMPSHLSNFGVTHAVPNILPRPIGDKLAMFVEI